MPDNPPTEVEGIVIVGQRRRYESDPFPDRGLPDPPLPGENAELPPDDLPIDDPCADPAKRMEWNADAAAAEAVKEFQRQAGQRNPPETLNHREWGSTILRRPDGSVTLGPISSGQFTFQNPGPGGLASVEIDWTVPPGWTLIGAIHTHFAGGHLPSGQSHGEGDQAVLQYIRDPLAATPGGDPDQARIYVAALTTGPVGHEQRAKINVYNHLNRDAAIQGEEGPEVNPDGQPCPG